MSEFSKGNESGTFTIKGPLTVDGTFKIPMTSIEKLEAAIERLEGMRSDDAWDVYDDYGINAIRKTIGGHKGPRPHRDGWGPGTWHAVGIDYSLADALLITTLHRTIDAQLSILRHFRVVAHNGGEYSDVYFPLAEQLADAILGNESQ